LKNTNTFYLYLKKKNFKDENTQLKYQRQELVLDRSMALTKDFPIGIISQIFENETYSIQEIKRDNRKIDYESYFIKGIG